MLETLITGLPTLLSIISVGVFSLKHKFLCYSIVLLSIAAEIVPFEINYSALFACSVALVAAITRHTLLTLYYLDEVFTD